MMKNLLKGIAFLIPALDPDGKMCVYIDELINAGAEHIILIDDGSCADNKKYFDKAAEHREVKVLVHDVNKGKGSALKTGISYILNNMSEIEGVVTSDSDGQHSCKDVINTAYKLIETKQIVLGSRNIDDPGVPFKSLIGNKITNYLLKVLYGKKIRDTQTGLRGLPKDFLNECLDLPGERFEFEIQMLIRMVKDNREIIELPIETIYESKKNHQTHFKPIKDSLKIYKTMFDSFFKDHRNR